ncbi:MAG: insulinase family protein [Rhodobacteraceae bacterium]|nr:insulinase family protein [Paracoccaceae bacterium]
MLRRFLTFLACAALASIASAEETPVTHFTLDNGLELVVVEDHRAPVVQHMIWYRVGAADEPPGASGVAHFLEHLMFKGTENMEAGEFSRVVAENGGRDNAFTSYDYTAYFQRVAADRLGLMMQMEADRMRNLALTEDDVLTERDVILEERSQRTDSNPRALFGEQMNATMFMNHGYSVPVIGWRHEMETLDMEDVTSFYRTHYGPNNAVLVVSGDVVPDEVLALAQEYYGPIPAKTDLPERTRTQEPPHLAPRRLTLADPRVSQPYVSRSYLAPERNSGDQREAAALELLAEVLGGGVTSVLRDRLQFETQEALWVGAFYNGMSLDQTSFGLVIVPAQGVSLEEAEAALDREIATFLETGVDPEQLDRIKLLYRASQIYARDDVDGIARRYGQAMTTGLAVEDVQAWPDIVQSITGEEIVAAARKVLRADTSVTGWLTSPDQEES